MEDQYEAQDRDDAEIFMQMRIQNMLQIAEENKPELPPLKLEDPGFVIGVSASAPPFQDYLSDGIGETSHTFISAEDDGRGYRFVQDTSKLVELEKLETEMTSWYDKYFFGNKIWVRKNWHKIFIGGYYAAWVDSMERWVRACASEWVYSEDKAEYLAGKYEVVIHLIDYGELAVVERHYLVPMRRDFMKFPVVASIVQGSAQIGSTLTQQHNDNEFRAFVVEQRGVYDMPYQVLQLLIAEKGKEDIQREWLCNFLRYYSSVISSHYSHTYGRGRGNRKSYANPFLQP